MSQQESLFVTNHYRPKMWYYTLPYQPVKLAVLKLIHLNFASVDLLFCLISGTTRTRKAQECYEKHLGFHDKNIN